MRLANNLAANAVTNVDVRMAALADIDGEFNTHASSLEGALAAGGESAGVLRGARETLLVHRPVVLVEVYSDKAGVEVAAELWRYGFFDLRTGFEASPPLTSGHFAAFPKKVVR